MIVTIDRHNTIIKSDNINLSDVNKLKLSKTFSNSVGLSDTKTLKLVKNKSDVLVTSDLLKQFNIVKSLKDYASFLVKISKFCQPVVIAGGGSGGSGVVYISVLTSKYTGTTTGSPTVTTNGSFTVMKFTSSGSYTA